MEFAITELDSYDRSEIEALGSTAKKVESGVEWDCSASSAWAEQKKRVEAETKKLKDIEAFTKTLKEKTTIVDEETGETTEFYPAVKSSSTTVRVTIS